MEWWHIFIAVFSILGGALLVWLEVNHLKDQAQRRRIFDIVSLAHQVVFWAKDTFPGQPGLVKLHEAVNVLKNLMKDRGWNVSKAEAEVVLKAAYQEDLAIPEEENPKLAEARQKAKEIEKRIRSEINKAEENK